MTADDPITTASEGASYQHDENIIFLEEYLSKPQPPTPSISTSTTNSSMNDEEDGNICQEHTSVNDDLFYRLQKENARLPPQVNLINYNKLPAPVLLNFCTHIGLYSIYSGPDRTSKCLVGKGSKIHLYP